MVLLRRVIGDALRARRQGQQRTLREVSTAANVSLGYLSEIERGQKEASSELLAAVCDALGARLSEVLREVSDTVALAEQMPAVLVPVQDQPAAVPQPSAAEPTQGASSAGRAGSPVAHVTVPAGRAVGSAGDARKHRVSGGNMRKVATGGRVSVSVRQDFPLPAAGPNSPLKATLTTTRRVRSAERDVVCAA